MSGVRLSDGHLCFAILKHRPNTSRLGPDQASDVCGIGHIGLMVDDQRATVAEPAAANVTHVRDNPSGHRPAASAAAEPDHTPHR
jgi:hypothetical protein